MSDSDPTQKQLPYPVRLGAVPTADGVFPVDLSGGGTRRKRRSHIDLDGHDIRAHAANERLVESQALEEIEAILQDETNPLAVLIREIREAAPIIRAQDLLKSAQFRANPIVERLKQPAAEEPPAGNVTPMQPISEALEELDAAGILFVRESADAGQFVERLSSQPADVVKSILGDLWNGDDDTFADAAAARWSALHPQTLPSDPVAETPGGELATGQTADGSTGNPALQAAGHGSESPAGQTTEAPKTPVVPDPPKTARKRAANAPEK